MFYNLTGVQLLLDHPDLSSLLANIENGSIYQLVKGQFVSDRLQFLARCGVVVDPLFALFSLCLSSFRSED